MTLTETKRIAISLTDEEIKAIELTHKLAGSLYNSLKTSDYERIVVNLGYGDYDSLSLSELLDLSEMLSRLSCIEEMR